MVAGSNLSWQGIKRKAVYTKGAGLVCKCTGQCTLGVYRVGNRDLGVQNFFKWFLKLTNFLNIYCLTVKFVHVHHLHLFTC